MDSQLPKEQHLGSWRAEVSASIVEESYLEVWGVFLCVCVRAPPGFSTEEKPVKRGGSERDADLQLRKDRILNANHHPAAVGHTRIPQVSSLPMRIGRSYTHPLRYQLSCRFSLSQHAAFETLSEKTCSISQPDLVAFLWFLFAKVAWDS